MWSGASFLLSQPCPGAGSASYLLGQRPPGPVLSCGVREVGLECSCWECVISHVRLFATPWTIAHQASPAMEFPRQDYWSGLPFPSPRIYLPDPGIEPRSPALQADSLTVWACRERSCWILLCRMCLLGSVSTVSPIIRCARSQSTLLLALPSAPPHLWDCPFSLMGTLTVGPGVSQALWLQNCRCRCARVWHRTCWSQTPGPAVGAME